MNIFGVTLSDADLWLLGIAGALAMVPIVIRATNAINQHHADVVAYRSAFDDVLLNIRESPDCPLAQIAYGCNPQITAAIDKRRGKVMIWRRNSFERDVAYYKESYIEATQDGSVLAVAMSEKTESAQQNRARFLRAINRLLSHA